MDASLITVEYTAIIKVISMNEWGPKCQINWLPWGRRGSDIKEQGMEEEEVRNAEPWKHSSDVPSAHITN